MSKSRTGTRNPILVSCTPGDTDGPITEALCAITPAIPLVLWAELLDLAGSMMSYFSVASISAYSRSTNP
jgi:hypothetical protein